MWPHNLQRKEWDDAARSHLLCSKFQRWFDKAAHCPGYTTLTSIPASVLLTLGRPVLVWPFGRHQKGRKARHRTTSVNRCVCGVHASSLRLLADCVLVLIIWLGSSSQAERSSTSAWVSRALGSPEGHWEGCDPTGPPAELPGGRGMGVSLSQRGVMLHRSANKTRD